MSNAQSSFDTGRFVRLLTLIAFVTGVFLATAATTFGDRLFTVALFAIGTIGVLSTIIGFLVAANSYLAATENA